MDEAGTFQDAPTLPLAIALVGLASFAGCTPHIETGPEDDQRAVRPIERAGTVITREEILHSGAHDAWEAIRRHGSYLRFAETDGGDPIRVTQRGPDSITFDDEVLLVVDGTRVGDIGYLRDIPAKTIAKIQILSGSEGTIYYGLDGARGAVLVSTTPP